MRNLLFLIVTTLGVSAPALADPTPQQPAAERALMTAAVAERDATARVTYYTKETAIAEGDVAIAQLQLDTARRSWDAAVRAHDSGAAATWAQRHFAAHTAEQEASGRLLNDRAERDLARAEVRRRADEVRRIAIEVARREHARG